MKRSKRIPVIAAAIALPAIALALALAHATPAPARGPYASALGRADGTPMAAAPKCNGSICEFVAPGYHCLFEGGKNLCQTGSGGCTNVACR